MPVLGKAWSMSTMSNRDNSTRSSSSSLQCLYFSRNDLCISQVHVCLSILKHKHMPVLAKAWSVSTKTNRDNSIRGSSSFLHCLYFSRNDLCISQVHVCAYQYFSISTCLCLGKHGQCQLRVTETTQREASVHFFTVYTSVETIYVSPRYMSVLINIKELAHACAWESIVSVN